MRIFLSYRREDSSAWAGRLRDALAARVGDENVFQDVAAVHPGQDFTAAIDGALGRADATLAVIGPHWLTAASADGLRHLSDERDHVRAELSAALRLGGLIVPVLVGRATMPNPEQLPADLQPLAVLQAVTLSDETWSRDVEDLFEAIGVASSGRTRRMILVAVIAVAAVLVAAAGLLLRPDDDASSADEVTTGATVGGPATTFDPFALKAQCFAPADFGDWDELTASGTGDVGPSGAATANVDVLAAHSRPADDGGWDVVVRVDFTGLTNSSEQQYWWYYTLATGELTFDPACFSVIGGQDPACCGEVSEVLVGFDASSDPTAGAALLVKANGNSGRVDLTPS
jgi:hypothetical protein